MDWAVYKYTIKGKGYKQRPDKVVCLREFESLDDAREYMADYPSDFVFVGKAEPGEYQGTKARGTIVLDRKRARQIKPVSRVRDHFEYATVVR